MEARSFLFDCSLGLGPILSSSSKLRLIRVPRIRPVSQFLEKNLLMLR